MAEELNLLPDGVLVLDGAGLIVRANGAAAALTGHPVDGLVRQPCATLLQPRSRDGHPLLRDGWGRAATVLPGVRALGEQEVTIRHAAGEDIRVMVTGTYQRDAEGRVNGVVLALRPAARRGQTAAAGIEIVSTVSHELRSPLTSVKGYTSLLLNRWDRLKDDQKRMMLEQVNHDADRVTRLITELLDISRLETGRLVLRRQLIDLSELAAGVVDKVRMEYGDLDAHLHFPEIFPKVYADPDKIVQVLTNLVENACKYASPIGLEVRGVASEEDVAVAVTDRGEGIPRDDLVKVFTKFFRRAEGKPTGSGLGLWISRGLVEAHGGRLTARSEVGEGSTFQFTLPVVDFDELHPS